LKTKVLLDIIEGCLVILKLSSCAKV